LEDLSLHILDVCENSIKADAAKIEIMINEDTVGNKLLLEIKDDGKGLDKETLSKVLDPFYTTRKTRRVGLGLPMLAQAAKEAEGDINIESQEGIGTCVTVKFVHNHIDRKPLGNIAETIISLISMEKSDIDIVYTHQRDGNGFQFDTREIKEELQDVPINNPEVINFLRETIKNGLKELEKEKK
jgi:nitrogen fixation/metabolism regulation signal transduction histidine kinase